MRGESAWWLSIKASEAEKKKEHPLHSPASLTSLTVTTMLSKSLLAFVTAALSTMVSAGVEPVFVKQSVNWTEHQFMAPGSDDVRSPCPGLNTYAATH